MRGLQVRAADATMNMGVGNNSGVDPVDRVGRADTFEPTIGVITALPKELASVRVMLDAPTTTMRDGRSYETGTIPAHPSGTHGVVAALLPSTGNNLGAVVANQLIKDFPSVLDLVVVGIAGAAPCPAKPDVHVRLGDVVVSGDAGIIQYDLVKRDDTGEQARNPPRPPSARLLAGAKLIESQDPTKGRHWLDEFERGANLENSARPHEDLDRLLATPPASGWLEHPYDPRRRAGEPRIFIGALASGNTLLKDAVLRDRLQTKFNVRAVEMESSGVADAAWKDGRSYFTIRGTCDYCDTEKNDEWQEYAALAAAAYFRGLLRSTGVGRNSSASLTPSPVAALKTCISEDSHLIQFFVLLCLFGGLTGALVGHQVSFTVLGAVVGTNAVLMMLFIKGWLQNRLRSRSRGRVHLAALQQEMTPEAQAQAVRDAESFLERWHAGEW